MNAPIDENFVHGMLGALNTTGRITIPIRITPSTHTLHVSDGTTGTDFGPKNALRDENNTPSLLGVSSSDFSTVVTVYADANGRLLIQSN